MGKKGNNRRKRYNKRKKRFYKGSARAVQGDSGRLMPFPQRYRGKFTATLNGVMASGGQAQRLFNAKLNSILTPYNVAATGSSTLWEGPFVALANIDLAGLSNILNANLYTQYRVYASKIRLCAIPENIQDNVYCSITPTTTASQPSNYSAALAQPYTKSTTYCSNKMAGSEWLTCYMSVAELIGVTHRSVQDDVSTVYNALYNGDPNDLMYWAVNFCQADNVAPADDIAYTVKITYYVECYALSTGTMVQ